MNKNPRVGTGTVPMPLTPCAARVLRCTPFQTDRRTSTESAQWSPAAGPVRAKMGGGWDTQNMLELFLLSVRENVWAVKLQSRYQPKRGPQPP